MVIAERMADQGMGDLDAIIDPMFLKSKDQNIITPEIFKDFILKDLKTNLLEKDIDLFLKSHPVLSKGN